jgi:hypothetical protein
MGRIIQVIKDKDNVARVVKVKTENTTLTRPITKLCLLVENDCLTGVTKPEHTGPLIGFLPEHNYQKYK